MAKRTVVVVVTRNARGLLQRIMASFAHQGLSVTEATIKTLPGDIARDTCACSEAPLPRPRPPRASRTTLSPLPPPTPPSRLLSSLLRFEVVDAATGEPIACARERLAIEGRLRRDLWPRADERGLAVASNEIRVSVPDRPGLLSEITASLSDLNLSIVGASIQTTERADGSGGPPDARDTFSVIDATTRRRARRTLPSPPPSPRTCYPTFGDRRALPVLLLLLLLLLVGARALALVTRRPHGRAGPSTTRCGSRRSRRR